MTKKLKKRYDITQCALYKCRNQRRLASILQISNEELKNLRNSTEYYSFTKSKKDGDKRIITAPKNYLKKIQKRALRLLTYVQRPEWLISGERGKCYIHNGMFHLNSEYFLTIDIRKFYDNCKREYVYKFFIDTMCVSRDIAGILTDIVTFDGGIPTGCPTSQMIAFYAYQEMFKNINEIAEKFGCIFTLYVDDMTFSSKNYFNPNKLKNEIDIELRKFGHKPKYRKVKYYPRKSHKLVTGVVVSKDHKLLVANNLQKKIYTKAMYLKKLIANKESIQTHELDHNLCSLKGQVQAARNVNSSIFPEINQLLVNHIKSSN